MLFLPLYSLIGTPDNARFTLVFMLVFRHPTLDASMRTGVEHGLCAVAGSGARARNVLAPVADLIIAAAMHLLQVDESLLAHLLQGVLDEVIGFVKLAGKHMDIGTAAIVLIGGQNEADQDEASSVVAQAGERGIKKEFFGKGLSSHRSQSFLSCAVLCYPVSGERVRKPLTGRQDDGGKTLR
jgi:hypothetical protein